MNLSTFIIHFLKAFGYTIINLTEPKHLNKCTFYTDNWSAFAEVLPKQRHIIGKKYTTAIERDNSNHHLGRFTRRTKVVSQKQEMVEASLKLWQALTNDGVFKAFQDIALTIFR